MNKKMIRNNIIALLAIQFIIAQDFDVLSPQITGGQINSNSETYTISSSTSALSTEASSSDSFAVSQGVTGVVQSLYSLPPVVNAFIADTIYRDGMPIRVQGILKDLNGIASAELYLQQGGSAEQIVIPMTALNDSIYEVSIAESLVTIRNFRAFIRGDDNMAYSGESQKLTPIVKFGKSELTTLIDNSVYPNGILSDHWRMLSFPGSIDDPIIKNPKDDGHVFYVWDLENNNWIVPDSIMIGQAYWFKHLYEDPLPFSADSGMAIALKDYTINLKSGWNMIGSPFAFPVAVDADPGNVSALYFYGDSLNRDGWQVQNYVMKPWAGYAIYADHDDATIDLIPFPDNSQNNNMNRIASSNWKIILSAESSMFIDRSAVIGRDYNAKEYKDKMDIPSLPSLNNGLSIAISLDNESEFNYSSDIRSMDEVNGVWSVNISSAKYIEGLSFSAELDGILQHDVIVAVLDIQTRNIYRDILFNSISINDRLESAYELKIIIGEPAYVESMLLEITSQIPSEFSLGQNYPNPFNPQTKLDYLLPRNSFVSIRIYNMLGQEIITLLEEEKRYGKYSVLWNGLDRNGKQVASGVYFTELKAKGFRMVRKMLMLK